MPRSKRPDGVRITDPEELAQARRLDLFGSDASVDGIQDWDLKPEVLAQVVLGALAHGQAIMFGVTRDGTGVSIAVKQGEFPWQRKYVHDGYDMVELLDAMAARLPKRPSLKLMTGD